MGREMEVEKNYSVKAGAVRVRCETVCRGSVRAGNGNDPLASQTVTRQYTRQPGLEYSIQTDTLTATEKKKTGQRKKAVSLQCEDAGCGMWPAGCGKQTGPGYSQIKRAAEAASVNLCRARRVWDNSHSPPKPLQALRPTRGQYPQRPHCPHRPHGRWPARRHPDRPMKISGPWSHPHRLDAGSQDAQERKRRTLL